MRILDFHLHYNGNIDDAERFAGLWREGGVQKAVVFGLIKTVDEKELHPKIEIETCKECDE